MVKAASSPLLHDWTFPLHREREREARADKQYAEDCAKTMIAHRVTKQLKFFPGDRSMCGSAAEVFLHFSREAGVVEA